MSEPTTFSEALASDKAYANHIWKRDQLTENIYEIQRQQTIMFWEIQALLRAADLCQSKRSDILESDDEALIRNTGECSDCWDTNWHTSTQTIFAHIEFICKKISDLTLEKNGLHAEKDELQPKIDTALNRVRKEFYAQQES